MGDSPALKKVKARRREGGLAFWGIRFFKKPTLLEVNIQLLRAKNNRVKTVIATTAKQYFPEYWILDHDT